MRRKLRLHFAKLCARWQSSMPQQMTHFLERGVLRKVVDVVAAIREHAPVAIEITNRGGCDDDVFEAGLRSGIYSH